MCLVFDDKVLIMMLLVVINLFLMNKVMLLVNIKVFFDLNEEGGFFIFVKVIEKNKV